MTRISLLFVLLLASVMADAQVYKLNTLPGRPQPQLSTNVTVTATPATVNFALATASSAAGDNPVSINSSWLLGLFGTVKLYAYFSSSTNALINQDNASSVIPSAHILGSINSGGFAAFSATSPFSGLSSLQIFSQSSVLGLLQSRTDTLSLKIDLSAQPQLPAGTYKGTLILQAQAM